MVKNGVKAVYDEEGNKLTIDEVAEKVVRKKSANDHLYAVVREMIECDWCGKRHGQTVKQCPHCGAANMDWFTHRMGLRIKNE